MFGSLASWFHKRRVRTSWQTVVQWQNECVHRGMDGRHRLLGVKTVVGELNARGARRIRVLSAPPGVRRKGGSAWDLACEWRDGDMPVGNSLVSADPAQGDLGFAASRKRTAPHNQNPREPVSASLQ